jgi:hypothetical protein
MHYRLRQPSGAGSAGRANGAAGCESGRTVN